MHILLIPSEEFIPPYNKLDGIFQYHQARILKEAGHRVGVLSVKLSFSIPMIFKAVFLKVIGKKAGNAADDYTALGLIRLGVQKLFHSQRFITKEIIEGLKVYRIDGLFYRPPVHNKNHVSWLRAGAACFEEYVKHEGRPEIIHAHNAIYAGMLAKQIKEKFDLNYIITEHSSTYALGQAETPTLKLVKEAFEKASGLFAVSEAFATSLNKQFAFQRFRYLPNVLDQHLETYQYQPTVRNHDKFIFLHIAGLQPVKDQKTLLNAYARVVAKNSATELWIGGHGELQEELEAQVQCLGIQNSVKFLGLLSRDEVINRLQACDCFVLSSKYETFGVVVIEAMLFGKPVIVTRVGVGQTIVDEKIGHVVEVGDANQLADAMLKMAASHSAYDAGFIRNYTITHFGRDAFLTQVNKIYTELVDGGAKAEVSRKLQPIAS